MQLVDDLLQAQPRFKADPDNPNKVMVPVPGGEWASLALTPFVAESRTADAGQYFSGLQNAGQLLDAYEQARQDKPFEEDIPYASDTVTPYAAQFKESILTRGRNDIDDDDASRIARLVSNLDIYSAVKAVESLLNSVADRVLLRISEQRGWTLHFDHLAMRCGCSDHGDAERVVENLCRHHGYTPCQLAGENYYRFKDGWDAYVLYKVLENGQQLRLFIDESLAEYPEQIIQHWNHVYGYTAHHLALRATCVVEGCRVGVPLAELIAAMESGHITAMTATGQYTGGLLEQVFTKPERNSDIPKQIRRRLRQFDSSLEASIENGKLLELLSRREMKQAFKAEYFGLYGIDFDNDNPLHSAPIYPYFLPAQAAHVIRTSVQVA